MANKCRRNVGLRFPVSLVGYMRSVFQIMVFRNLVPLWIFISLDEHCPWYSVLNIGWSEGWNLVFRVMVPQQVYMLGLWRYLAILRYKFPPWIAILTVCW